MTLPALATALVTGLFMGWLMGVIWQSDWLSRLAQIGIGAAGGLLGYWVFLATVDQPVAWLGALALSAFGAMTVSILVNVGAILGGGAALATPPNAPDIG